MVLEPKLDKIWQGAVVDDFFATVIPAYLAEGKTPL